VARQDADCLILRGKERGRDGVGLLFWEGGENPRKREKGRRYSAEKRAPRRSGAGGEKKGDRSLGLHSGKRREKKNLPPNPGGMVPLL